MCYIQFKAMLMGQIVIYFAFLFGLAVYCCFCNFRKSILTVFLGVVYNFKRNSTTQRHNILRKSNRVNRFNKLGSDMIICKSVKVYSVVILQTSSQVFLSAVKLQQSQRRRAQQQQMTAKSHKLLLQSSPSQLMEHMSQSIQDWTN